MHQKYFNLFLILLCILILLLPFSFVTTAYAQKPSLESTGGGNGATTELNKDFDTRTKSSLKEDVFKEYFKGGLLENTYSTVMSESEKYGVNAGFISAIMAHESSRGKSDMIKEFNNPGGLTCKQGSSGDGWTCEKRSNGRYWMKFNSVETAIKYKVEYIQRAYHKSDPARYTIYDIQQKYCPDSDGDCATTWVRNVLKHMEGLGEGQVDGIMSPSDSKESLDTEGTSGSVYDSPFTSYQSDIDNLGVNDGQNYDTTYSTYKTSKYIGYLRDGLTVVGYVLAVLISAYMFILWLAVLLARTHLDVAHKFVLTITFNLIDAHEDLGKLTKITIVVALVIVISLSGLLPKIFQLIYWLFSKFIMFVFRL